MKDFEVWSNDQMSALMQDPVNLLELGCAIGTLFGEGREIELIKRAIILLIKEGKHPIFRDSGTGIWEWTDRLYVTPEGDVIDTPNNAAEMAVMRWQAFGSGEVAQFWFGTRLPTGPGV